MRVDLESFKGKIDFGIISIREDEFLAVLERFAPDSYALGDQRYEIGTVRSKGGGYYTVAAVRCMEQGRAHAQKVATDLIGDLAPRWLLVVGIGGAVPSMDFTLGDVVCATRVHDFSVRAVKEGATDTYNAGGGPMHPEIQRLLASLPAIVTRELGEWNSPEAVGTPKPTLRVPPANSDRYYGDVKWKAELRRTLLHHFPKDQPPRRPLVTSQSVATSDALVKSTKLLSQWQEYARGVAAVEMELGGVFLAARGIGRDHPILAIRGISDIVGFKREEQWTKYACATAAAFAYALLRAGAPFELRIAESTPKMGERDQVFTGARDQVFVAYSHADRRWLKELQTHLEPYIRNTKIAVWDDTKIRAGAIWKESLGQALASAKVAVLLVSPAFLASRFIAEEELPHLLEAAKSEGVAILWVPVRSSSFQVTPIADYQAAHSPDKPLASLPPAARDKALVKVCELIQQMYQR
jgi:nucleoside phosphorylase